MDTESWSRGEGGRDSTESKVHRRVRAVLGNGTCDRAAEAGEAEAAWAEGKCGFYFLTQAALGRKDFMGAVQK